MMHRSTCRKIILALVFVWTAAAAAFAESSDTRLVHDQLGRKVRVPASPRRIISLAPSITEIIFELQQEDRLIGVTRYSNYPDAAAALPSVGSYVRLDLEKIISLEPDLCIAVKDGNPRAVVLRLESLGIPVYAVDPRNLSSIMDTMREIGGLLNAEKIAQDRIQRLQDRVARVQDRVGRAGDAPGVFFQIGISPIVSIGAGTLIDELIERAGGRNLARGDEPYPRFSREQVLMLQPDIIIISSMARSEEFDRVLTEWAQWPDIPAVRNHRVALVDSDIFDRPSPRSVRALESLAALIHPEVFGENP
jgi:iron complex transport system substrate-binding protein